LKTSRFSKYWENLQDSLAERRNKGGDKITRQPFDEFISNTYISQRLGVSILDKLLRTSAGFQDLLGEGRYNGGKKIRRQTI
jgi:hypothetical protein